MATVLIMHILKQILNKCLDILSESLSLSVSIHSILPPFHLSFFVVEITIINRTYTFFKGSKDCAVISRAVNTMVIITVTSFGSVRMKGHSNSTNDPASVWGQNTYHIYCTCIYESNCNNANISYKIKIILI